MRKTAKRAVLLLKVLRGRYDGFMPHVISKLKALFPGRKLLFVAPPRAMRWLPFDQSEVDEILPIEGTGLSPRRALFLLRTLGKKRVEEVVLVYDGRFPLGYLKMEALALLTGKPEVTVFVREVGPERRSRWWLLWRVAFGTAYLALNLLASLIYALLVAAVVGLFDLLSSPFVLLLSERGRASDV